MSYDLAEKPAPAVGQSVRQHYDAKAGRILKKAIKKVTDVLHPGFTAAVIIVTPDGHVTFASNMNDRQARSVIGALSKEMKVEELKPAGAVIEQLTKVQVDERVIDELTKEETDGPHKV
jgi:hypothetical protein